MVDYAPCLVGRSVWEPLVLVVDHPVGMEPALKNCENCKSFRHILYTEDGRCLKRSVRVSPVSYCLDWEAKYADFSFNTPKAPRPAE
jgi:hypothetical protein